MLKTVCPPIKLINGAQSGMLDCSRERSLKVLRLVMDFPSHTLPFCCQWLLSLNSNCQGNSGGLATCPPLPGKERHLPLAYLTCSLPWKGQNRTAPARMCECVCMVCVHGACAHRKAWSPPESGTLCWAHTCCAE